MSKIIWVFNYSYVRITTFIKLFKATSQEKYFSQGLMSET